jgi:hypothetical protein
MACCAIPAVTMSSTTATIVNRFIIDALLNTVVFIGLLLFFLSLFFITHYHSFFVTLPLITRDSPTGSSKVKSPHVQSLLVNEDPPTGQQTTGQLTD